MKIVNSLHTIDYDNNHIFYSGFTEYPRDILSKILKYYLNLRILKPVLTLFRLHILYCVSHHKRVKMVIF